MFFVAQGGVSPPVSRLFHSQWSGDGEMPYQRNGSLNGMLLLASPAALAGSLVILERITFGPISFCN